MQAPLVLEEESWRILAESGTVCTILENSGREELENSGLSTISSKEKGSYTVQCLVKRPLLYFLVQGTQSRQNLSSQLQPQIHNL